MKFRWMTCAFILAASEDAGVTVLLHAQQFHIGSTTTYTALDVSAGENQDLSKTLVLMKPVECSFEIKSALEPHVA